MRPAAATLRLNQFLTLPSSALSCGYLRPKRGSAQLAAEMQSGGISRRACDRRLPRPSSLRSSSASTRLAGCALFTSSAEADDEATPREGDRARLMTRLVPRRSRSRRVKAWRRRAARRRAAPSPQST